MDNTTNIISTIGFTAMFGGFIYIGRKLQILDDLKITVDKIKANLKIVADFLTRNANNFDPTELQDYSPLTLTLKGEGFIKQVGFDKIFKENKKDFFHCVDAESPRLKYDVEVAAIKSVSILSDRAYMNFLKILFYNDPKRNMENTAPTLGVYIRDSYLAEHPEIIE